MDRQVIAAATLADIASAIHAARQGRATEDDWDLIEWACGLAPLYKADIKSSLNTYIGTHHGTDRKEIGFDL